MNPRGWLSIVALSFGGACGTTNVAAGSAVPSLGAETTAGAIRAAEEIGAARSPAAALHLELAKEQFEHARKLTKPDDGPLAGRLLLRAQADAELALALVRED